MTSLLVHVFCQPPTCRSRLTTRARRRVLTYYSRESRSITDKQLQLTAQQRRHQNRPTALVYGPDVPRSKVQKLKIDDWVDRVKQREQQGRVKAPGFILTCFQRALRLHASHKRGLILKLQEGFTILLQHSTEMKGGETCDVLLLAYEAASSHLPMGKEKLSVGPFLQQSQKFRQYYRAAVLRALGTTEQEKAAAASDEEMLAELAVAQAYFHVRCYDFWEVVQRMLASRESLHVPALCDLLLAAATLKQSGIAQMRVSKELQGLLLQHVSVAARVMRGKEVAGALWALIKLGMTQGSVPDALMRAVGRQAPIMSGDEVAQALYTLGELRVGPRRVPEALRQAAEREARWMSATAVAKTLWGYAAVGLKAEHLPKPVIQAVHEVACEMNYEETPKAVFAFAEMGVATHLIPAALLKQAQLMARLMSPEDVATCWAAWPRMGLDQYSVPRSLKKALVRAAGEMSGRNVADALNAWVELEMAVHRVPPELVARVEHVAEEMDAESVVKTLNAWAYLSRDPPGPHWMLVCEIAREGVPQELRAAVARVGGHLSAAQVATALRAWAKIGMGGKLPRSLRMSFSQQAKNMNFSDVSTALAAWDRLGLQKQLLPHSLRPQ